MYAPTYLKPCIRFYLLLLFFFSLILSGCSQEEIPEKVSLDRRSSNTGIPAPQPEPGGLRFGFDLRLEPKEDVKIYLPFMRYLESNTGNKFSIRFTERYENTIENLGNGITHFAALGPVNSVLAIKRYGAGCLVMGLNSDGKPEYRAVIFTRINSPLNNIRDLKGRTFAFGDRFSTQGHIIPRKMLEAAGITLMDLKGYVFTGSHANTARVVLNGDYDAGSMQDALAKRFVAEGKIRILAASKPYPSSLICFNKNVDPIIVKAVKSALLSFDPKDKHAGILVDWDKTEMPDGFAEYREESLKEIEQLVKKYRLH
jgi:phosphonate transport system substrate-binding protein